MKPSTIVAIGFSAGGLEPLKTFFDNTPLDNTAYIVVSHLLPTHRSELAAILKRHSDLDILVVENNLSVEPNAVYVMPENYFMEIDKTRLVLHPRLGKYPNTAVDIFFNSLSKNKSSTLFAVIMSGTGKDGTFGIDSMKKRGGTIIVQDPASCAHSGMPESAIASGNVDFILKPEEMPAQIMAMQALISADKFSH
jgi:two-component system CheB/CheR fusion protein